MSMSAYKLNLLNAPRQGILEMEVDVRLPSMPLFPCFSKQDICSVIHHNRLSKALIYFPPKYTYDKKGRDKLYADLGKAALLGGDRITLSGRENSSNQVMYIRCQSSIKYRGTKVDKSTGSIIPRSDYTVMKPTPMTERITDLVSKGKQHLADIVVSAVPLKTKVIAPFHSLFILMKLVTT
jgi:hypothetical protein